MNSNLTILDISSVVYPRTVLKAKADFWGGKTETGREELQGLPIGGIREVLTRTFTKLRDQYPVVWAFDSRNSRKELSTEYKSSRVFSADIAIQTEILKDVGRKLDIPCLYADGFEADEIIYKIVNDNIDDYYTMDIISSDKGDLAGCIRTEGIRIVGATAGAPTISKDNYELSIRAGVPIKYNSVLPFNVFCGKPSNNLGVLHLPSKRKAGELYLDFLDFCKEKSVKPSYFSSFDVMKVWIATRFKSGMLTREDAECILGRCQLCYPREIPDLNCKIHQYSYTSLNENSVIEVLKMFQMGNLARFLGIKAIVSGAELSRADKTYLWRFKSLYEEGVFHVDNDLSLLTESFAGLEDFGVGDIE